MNIKPGHGYYDLTNYSLGGAFRRAPKDGGIVVYHSQAMGKWNGKEYVRVITSEGTRLGVAVDCLEH